MAKIMKKRILSGIQPSGKVHLGNYIGALSNWVKLQDEYDSFFFIADLHALTTGYADTSSFIDNIKDLKLDLLSIGLDPKRSTLFVQSDIPEHSELHLMFSMITPISWLERIPTYKSQIEALKERDLGTYGFLGYPVLMSADILIYKADAVPVGQDQLPHVELTREIGRRFNHFYGNVFPLPKDLLTEHPVLVGLDGRKMSKSYGNTIAISDAPDQIRKKISAAITDPSRIKKDDKGHPDICNVFSYHKIFNIDEVKQIEADCKAGSIGCVACKNNMADKLIQMLAPIQEKRKYYEAHPNEVKAAFEEGAFRARNIAVATLEEAKRAMRIK
jgi:tryptophanyl-tRNA synthetase